MNDLITKTKRVLLVVGDVIALLASLYISVAIRYGSAQATGQWQSHLPLFALIFFFWLIVFFINNFYDLKNSYNNSRLFGEIIKVSIINGALAVAILYFVAPLIANLRPQKTLIIELVISGILIFVWRKFFYTFIKSKSIANNVLFVGESSLSQELITEINNRPQLGYHATGIAVMPDDLRAYCLEHKTDILVAAGDLKNDTNVAKKIFSCLALGIDVYNINNFYEEITNKIPLEYIDHSWFLDNLAEHSKKLYEIIKRGADIILATVGLIIAIPIAPFIALIIKLESPGPVIFRQIRTGKNGNGFLAMKFRSMVQNAEKNGPQWAGLDDTRITRFGKFIRKTRLDEIPQLINILRGEMSLVGPRPERPEFIETLSQQIPFYNERLLVKPGLTGWAQLNGPAYGGSIEGTTEKLKYDLYYLKNRSLVLDLSIILKTVRVVFSGRGQ